jgi:hypothetical protein
MIQVEVFWIVMLHSVAVGYQCFGGYCCLHLHFTLKMKAQGPPKRYYPTAALLFHNPEVDL